MDIIPNPRSDYIPIWDTGRFFKAVEKPVENLLKSAVEKPVESVDKNLTMLVNKKIVAEYYCHY